MNFAQIALLILSASAPAAADDCPTPAAPLSSAQAKALAGAQASIVQKACSQQRSFLKSAYADRVKPMDVVEAAAASKAPVVIIGEGHFDRAEKFYKDLLERLHEKNPNLDCVAVEATGKDYQKALDACNAGPNCDRKALPIFSGVTQGLDLHLKVFAVDAEVESRKRMLSFFGGDADQKPINFLDEVNTRNHEMAKNVQQLIESKQCHGAVLIVGRNHAFKKPGLPSIPELLDENHVASYKIALASPGMNTAGSKEDLWTWTDKSGKKPLCGDMPGALGENFGFIKPKGGEGVPAEYTLFSNPFGPDKEFVGSWGDYDGAIFLGCSDSNAASCTPEGGKQLGMKGATYLATPQK